DTVAALLDSHDVQTLIGWLLWGGLIFGPVIIGLGLARISNKAEYKRAMLIRKAQAAPRPVAPAAAPQRPEILGIPGLALPLAVLLIVVVVVVFSAVA